MKRFLVPALLFSGWMAFLQTDVPAGDNFLPALGRFLSPFQGVWQSTSPDLASHTLKGQTLGEVRILFDDRDVPHIYADNLEDAVYAQGYLHAANRLFAMDMTSRSASGRLSEMVGPRTLAIDRRQRERGFEWSAIKKAESWETFEGNKPIMDAYQNGINAFIQQLDYKDWPLEYKILSHGPQTWTPTHSALILTSMAIALCLGEDDLEYSTAKARLSPEDFDFLFPAYNPLESPVIPSEKTWDFTALEPVSGESGKVIPVSQQKSKDSRKEDLNGSNSWAVSGGKTANGFPLLANDPHLRLTLPNIWYEMEIHTPDMSVHGVSIPGLPLIIIGFNEHIAWGSTNSGQDVLDWYQVTWQDSSRRSYQLDGRYVEATLRPEEIKVRGAKSVIDTIRYTHWGPVTHTDEHRDMAMKWIGHQKANTNDLEYVMKINKARNVAEYRNAVSAFQYPAQNKIFASTEGDIAISVAGVMPLRPAGNGGTVTSGNETSADWLGYIPFEHAPFIINPTRGYVSSANQRPVDAAYPYPVLGQRYFEDYRGREVNMMLDSMQGITATDMKVMQQNNFNLHAAEIMPLLMNAVATSACTTGEEKIIFDRLVQWNYEYHRDSLSPVLFEIWYEAFESLTWEELDTLGVMRPEEWRLIEIIRHDPANKFFDLMDTPDKVESFVDIACASFMTMVKSYRELPAEQQKNWGSYKQSHIHHLARFPHFGADLLHTSGGRHIINAMSQSHGPSWRMIVELSSPPKAWVNYPGGQSGDPASPHFRDMLAPFFEGHYYEVALRKDPDSWNPVHQISIQP